MTIGLSTMAGFWPDTYMCTDDNILATINRMLHENASDFPITACGGFDIKRCGQFWEITPIVLRNADAPTP